MVCTSAVFMTGSRLGAVTRMSNVVTAAPVAGVAVDARHVEPRLERQMVDVKLAILSMVLLILSYGSNPAITVPTLLS